jgi:hypothetical protein
VGAEVNAQVEGRIERPRGHALGADAGAVAYSILGQSLRLVAVCCALAALAYGVRHLAVGIQQSREADAGEVNHDLSSVGRAADT